MKKYSLLMLVAMFLFAGNLRAQEQVILLEVLFLLLTRYMKYSTLLITAFLAQRIFTRHISTITTDFGTYIEKVK